MDTIWQNPLNPSVSVYSKVHFFRQTYTPIEELNPKRHYPRNIVTDTIIGLTLALTTTINASRLKSNVKEINYAYYGR